MVLRQDEGWQKLSTDALPKRIFDNRKPNAKALSADDITKVLGGPFTSLNASLWHRGRDLAAPFTILIHEMGAVLGLEPVKRGPYK